MIFESTGDNPSDYELLCPQNNGFGELTRRPIEDFEECSWGVSPGNAIVVSSAMNMDMRQAIQIFLRKAVDLYGGFVSSGNETFKEQMEDTRFKLFESAPKYGVLNNLLLSDTSRALQAIQPDDMSYKSFLGRLYGSSLATPMKAIEGVRKCPVGDIKLCVTSDPELSKCVRMRTALNAQLLEPKMSCKKARSHMECMAQIRKGESDVVVLDAGDVYKAGWQYGLIPIMAEVYNLGSPHYYAVAVTKQRDNSSELIYLKRKNTCHSAVGHAAGWVIPMAWLIANERVR